ncbi:Bifunctional chorismate mutase/prephenate dehydratase [Buchnera aphidicola (Thelaxes suberi)]|uniref:prephenate dehydratase domain-containing protein n=1 Tax=Buchnera aphidicola TaxID=9 RepID=UPI003463E8CE
MKKKKIIEKIRIQINEIDYKIISLLAKRKMLAQEIAKEKILNNLNIKDKHREKELIDNIQILAKTKQLNTEFAVQIFKLIISNSIQEQTYFIQNELHKKIKKIALLGPEGSYSYLAFLEYQKNQINNYTFNIIKTDNFKEIINYVESNSSYYGLLPLENTSSGSIQEVFNLLLKHNVFIINEIFLLINHCLLSVKHANYSTIKTVYSHYQPLKQCSNFIKLFPHWKIKNVHSSSNGMEKISQYNSIEKAVLGSQEGGSLYNLKVIKDNIANKKNNITRFIIISNKPKKNKENEVVKMSFIFIVQNKINNLLKIIRIVQENEIIIHKIQTFPIIEDPIKHFFYFEIKHKLSNNNIIKIIDDIKNLTDFCKTLGSYSINNCNNF